MNKAKLKEAIENYEYNHSGISYNNGSYAKAVNIKITKDKVFADILLVQQFEGTTERYNECEYPREYFKELEE